MTMLNLLRRMKDTALGDCRSPQEIMEATVGRLNNLPMLPEAAHKALALVNDQDFSLAELSAIIERDVALATGILKLANSPLYRVGHAIGSLTQAVVRLGLRECQNLIIAVSMRSLFSKIGAAQKARCQALWRHAFITASLSRHLNQALGLGFRGEEFSCGLAHDIGRTLIAIGAPAYFDAVDKVDFQEGSDTLAREQQALGTDHCLFGAWFAARNQLPGSLVQVIQWHHNPSEAQEDAALIELVAAADHLANHIQREQAAEDYDPSTNPGWLLLLQRSEKQQEERFKNLVLPYVDGIVEEVHEVVNANAL